MGVRKTGHTRATRPGFPRPVSWVSASIGPARPPASAVPRHGSPRTCAAARRQAVPARRRSRTRGGTLGVCPLAFAEGYGPPDRDWRGRARGSGLRQEATPLPQTRRVSSSRRRSRSSVRCSVLALMSGRWCSLASHFLYGTVRPIFQEVQHFWHGVPAHLTVCGLCRQYKAWTRQHRRTWDLGREHRYQGQGAIGPVRIRHDASLEQQGRPGTGIFPVTLRRFTPTTSIGRTGIRCAPPARSSALGPITKGHRQCGNAQDQRMT